MDRSYFFCNLVLPCAMRQFRLQTSGRYLVSLGLYRRAARFWIGNLPTIFLKFGIHQKNPWNILLHLPSCLSQTHRHFRCPIIVARLSVFFLHYCLFCCCRKGFSEEKFWYCSTNLPERSSFLIRETKKLAYLSVRQTPNCRN